MAYVQKNNPIPRTGCGRRRMEQMINPFKMSKQALSKMSGQLKKASKLHAGQAAKIDKRYANENTYEKNKWSL